MRRTPLFPGCFVAAACLASLLAAPAARAADWDAARHQEP